MKNIILSPNRIVSMLTIFLTIMLCNSAYALSNSVITTGDPISIQDEPQKTETLIRLAAKTVENCEKLEGLEKTTCVSTRNWGIVDRLRKEQEVDPKGPKPKGWCQKDTFPNCCQLDCATCTPPKCDTSCGICVSSQECAYWDCGDNKMHGLNCGQCLPGGIEGGMPQVGSTQATCN